MYEYNSNKSKLRCFYKGATVNNYVAVDMINDSTKELLMFELNSGDYSSAKAKLYSFTGKKAKLLSETKLDSHLSSYVKIQTDNVDGRNYVYADAVGSNGESMLTEIIRWSTGYGAIVSPYYDYNSGVTSDSTRSVMITCRDIDENGVIDVPVDSKAVKKLPKTVACLKWRYYDDGPMADVCYTLSPKNDGYMIKISDDNISKISVKYDSELRQMTVLGKSDKKEVFSVISVLKAAYDEENFSDYERISEEKGYYYLAKTGSSKSVQISIDDLKKNIISI